MSILSEADFNRIRDSGMLFVILSESDGTYESYLKIYGKEVTDMDSELSWVGYSLEKSFLPADMSKCPSMPPVKPPLSLRPKHIVDRERMQEILEAMQRYVAEGKKIPAEWLGELDDLNETSFSDSSQG